MRARRRAPTLLALVAAPLVLARAAPAPTLAASICAPSAGVMTVSFSESRYPGVYRHWQDAVAKGWPRILVLDRVGVAGRRARLLAPIPTRPGLDRDEYPPAEGREGWLADVEYVPSAENRAQGASLGDRLRGACDGTRFQYAWTTP